MTSRTKANIELECQRLEMKRHFDNELKQRDLAYQQTIKCLEAQLYELTSHIQAINPPHPQPAPPNVPAPNYSSPPLHQITNPLLLTQILQWLILVCSM